MACTVHTTVAQTPLAGVGYGTVLSMVVATTFAVIILGLVHGNMYSLALGLYRGHHGGLGITGGCRVRNGTVECCRSSLYGDYWGFV